jgi:WD40 repeat protein
VQVLSGLRKVWDVAVEEKEERRLHNIRGHRGFISSAAFSSCQPKTVVTGSDDQTVKVWNLDEIKNSKPPNKKKSKMGGGEAAKEAQHDPDMSDDLIEDPEHEDDIEQVKGVEIPEETGFETD